MFATGGYARGLQTKAMMHRIDTDGDGTVSHDEFIAYQSKVFDMMDASKSGAVGPHDFLGK
jgi:Ca2+-binding EF-hand superfamily protein